MDFVQTKYTIRIPTIYIHKDRQEKLKKAGFVGNNLGQGNNDSAVGGFFYGLILAPKMKLCYTVD